MTSVYDETESVSNSLKAKDLGQSDVILTINSTEIAEFDEKNKDGIEYKKKRINLAFAETDKTLILNVTNLDMVVSHHGEDRAAWAGEKITLYPSTTPYNGENVACIRIRPPAAGANVSVGLPGAAPEHQTGGMGEASLGHATQDIPPAE